MRSRWAIFLSGRGSNAQAVMDLEDEISIGLVVSNKPDVWGVRRARRQGIPVHVTETPILWNQIQEKLLRYRIDKIFLLGFMKLVPISFLKSWEGRIFNLHPSLLPEFPGLHAIERSHQAYLQGQVEMGVTVHHVISEMDAGKKVFRKPSVTQETPGVDLHLAQLLISRDEQFLVRRWIEQESWRKGAILWQE